MPRQLADREKQFLKILGADPTINSGATFSDGDGVMHGKESGDYAVEVKSTDAKSFSIKLDTWKKIKKQANRIHQTPLLAVDIQKTQLIVLELNEFIMLWEYYNHADY